MSKYSDMLEKKQVKGNSKMKHKIKTEKRKRKERCHAYLKQVTAR